jgi:hypothetical protein
LSYKNSGIARPRRSKTRPIADSTNSAGAPQSRIESGAITAASAPISSACSRFSIVSAPVWPVIPAHASILRPIRLEVRRDRLSARIVHSVPFAGGAGGEQHVGAAAALDQKIDQRALLVFEQAPLCVEHRDQRH